MKFVDYKFMILIGLSLVVYFLYREIELVNKRVGRLEHVPLEESTLKVIDNVIAPDVQIHQLEEPLEQLEEPLEQFEEQFEEPNNLVDLNVMNTLPNNHIVEEYSNDSSEIDNNDIAEIDTLMVESLVKFIDISTLPEIDNVNISTVINTDNLVKHKLIELREIANELNISLTIDGSNKKKTKLQLIQEITNKKNNLNNI